MRAFAQAIDINDADKIMEMSSGEIECVDKQVFTIGNAAARTVLSDEKSQISACLHRASQAILALGSEMNGAEDDMRVWEKGENPGAVAKFPTSSPLKEVVSVIEARKWRIYEVTFR